MSIIDFFKKLFGKKAETKFYYGPNGQQSSTDLVYGKLFLPTIVRDSDNYADFRDNCLPSWIAFFQSKGVLYEVNYVDNRGPEVVRTAVSKYKFFYAINLHVNYAVNYLSVVSETGTMPNGETFQSFVRYQINANKYFGVREVNVNTGAANLIDVFNREKLQYGMGGIATSFYTPDEARFAYLSHYLKEKGLVGSEYALSDDSWVDSEFHSNENGRKIIVPCGHGRSDYSTGHYFESSSYDHKHKIIVSDTCQFLKDLGNTSPVGDYLACFCNTNYGWADAQKTNWFERVFGGMGNYKISGSSKYVEYFLSRPNSETIGERAYGAIATLNAGISRIQDGTTMGSTDTVAGTTFDFGDASFVLFGNPAFKI